MTNQVPYADIVDKETDGENAALLINDTKRAINEVITETNSYGNVITRSTGTQPDELPLNSDLPASAKSGEYADLTGIPSLGTAASVDTGVAPENVPLNSDLGDSSTRNVGLNTGDVLSPEGAGLDGGETNYTSGNLNPNVFDADTVGDRVASGGGVTSGVATFLLATSLDSAASSITVVGTYNVTTLFGAIVSGGAGVTPTLSSASSSKATNIIVSGLSGLTDNTPLFLKAVSASSKITVNS